MKSGSVVLDMAASGANNGNVETSQENEIIHTSNGVKIIGFSNLPSRLPTTSSELFGNNVAKFILSAGPTTNASIIDKFYPAYDDPAVRGMLVLDRGELRYPNDTPYELPAPSLSPTSAETEDMSKSVIVKGEEVDSKDAYLTTSLQLSGVILLLYLYGTSSGASSSFTSLMSIFLLSSFAGQQVIWGVVPALHSPLMAVTNAISGATAVGAIALLGNKLFPTSSWEYLGVISLFLSVVNIVGIPMHTCIHIHSYIYTHTYNHTHTHTHTYIYIYIYIYICIYTHQVDLQLARKCLICSNEKMTIQSILNYIRFL